MAPRDLALALLVVILWGLNFIAIKWGVAEISPFLLTALRYIFCALPAVFFVPRPKVPLVLLLGYGLFVGVLQFGFLFTAIKLGMPAGLSSVIIQIQAFFTMGLAVLLLKERPGRFQFVGAAVAFAGLAVIGSQYLGGGILGVLLMTLASALSWSVSNIITKLVGNKVNMLGFVVWGCLVPPIPMLLLTWFADGPTAFAALTHLSLRAIGSVLFIAYGSTLIGYGIWATLIGRYPASTVAPFPLLVPVVGFAGALLLLGEEVSALEYAGSALIFLGLALNVFGPRLLARRRTAPQ